jgi:hypothetical protein
MNPTWANKLNGHESVQEITPFRPLCSTTPSRFDPQKPKKKTLEEEDFELKGEEQTEQGKGEERVLDEKVSICKDVEDGRVFRYHFLRF